VTFKKRAETLADKLADAAKKTARKSEPKKPSESTVETNHAST
jgi:hypothetical protein